MKHLHLLILLFLAGLHSQLNAQDIVPIDNYSVNLYGQAQLSIEGESGKYYIFGSAARSII
jgi:hypothetical protein